MSVMVEESSQSCTTTQPVKTSTACKLPAKVHAATPHFSAKSTLARLTPEQKMAMNLDLDSPVLDDMELAQCREAFAKVKQLLETAAHCLVGLSSEALLEAEVIGACALCPVSASDTVDVLCKASQIDGYDLFEQFKQLLQDDPAARCVREHPEVFVGSALSGLRFSYAQFEFKIFFAKVPWDERDEETFHSLNSCLLARSLNENIPNASSFSIALRMVKLWAQRRGIYGKTFGYPGGPSWSICLARSCQMYPTANGAELVTHFFREYSRWDWRTVISLLDVPEAKIAQTNPVEGQIAVMTPGINPVNTAGYIKSKVLPILQEELRRAYKLSRMVEKCNAHWSDLYALPSIATKHKHYIRLEFLAQSMEALELLVEWGEVSLPTFLDKFETDLPRVQVRVWSQRIMVKHDKYAFACSFFVGLRFTGCETGATQEVDLRIPIVNFLDMLDKWPWKDYFDGQYDVTIQHVRRADLQKWWASSVGDVPNQTFVDDLDES